LRQCAVRSINPMSAAFAEVGDIKRRLVSVGRYTLRGVSHPRELFTIDPDSQNGSWLILPNNRYVVHDSKFCRRWQRWVILD
jgi:hypothetical protein